MAKKLKLRAQIEHYIGTAPRNYFLPIMQIGKTGSTISNNKTD